MAKNGFATVTLLLLAAIPVTFFFGPYLSRKSSYPTPIQTPTEKLEVLIEKIPGSKFHSPDATWWGYNQSKIVRYRDKVFSYYILNEDDSNKTSSKFVVLMKDGEKSWQEGASFTTSRPGNLLIDSKGVLHAFVFEPFDVQKNDSWGKIIHYWFPDSSKGDVKNFKQETVVDNDGTSETANIRVGAAIGADDTMAISFGLTKFNPIFKEQSEHIYFKKPEEEKWQHAFIDGLAHDYFYPFTLVSKNSFYLLPVQDDYAGSASYNIYQKIILFEYKNDNWNSEMIVDLSNHPLAQKQARLLEQEDLYQDKVGKLHIIYKEFLDPKNDFAPTVHWHISGKMGKFISEQMKLEKPGVNWVRIVEVDGGLYYLITTFGELLITPIESIKLTKIDIPEDAKNNYPYVSTIKGGSSNSDFVDILLLGADKKFFEEGKITNYYLRIPKEKFSSLKR